MKHKVYKKIIDVHRNLKPHQAAIFARGGMIIVSVDTLYGKTKKRA